MQVPQPLTLYYLTDGTEVFVRTVEPFQTSVPMFNFYKHIPSWLYKWIMLSELLEDMLWTIQYEMLPGNYETTDYWVFDQENEIWFFNADIVPRIKFVRKFNDIAEYVIYLQDKFNGVSE